MTRPPADVREQRAIRSMLGGSHDGLVESAAPIAAGGLRRAARLGATRIAPDPVVCLYPYDDYAHAPHTSSPQPVPDGRLLASMVRSDEIRLGWWASTAAFLDGAAPETVDVFLSGLRAGGESSGSSVAPVATVSRAGDRTWLCASWVADDVNADGDNRIVTRLWDSPDGNGDSWEVVQTLREITYDPDSLSDPEFRLTPKTSRVIEHDGRLLVMGAYWYLRSGDWVANHWGVWASDDGGDSWQLEARWSNGPVGGPYTDSMGRNLAAFGSRLYACTSDDYGGINNRLRYSDDGGATWTIAWNVEELPWDADQRFFGLTVLDVGTTLLGWYKQPGSPADRVHVGKSSTPTDLASWEPVDVFDCESHLDTLAYHLDGRQWFEGNGGLTKYLPGSS